MVLGCFLPILPVKVSFDLDELKNTRIMDLDMITFTFVDFIHNF